MVCSKVYFILFCPESELSFTNVERKLELLVYSLTMADIKAYTCMKNNKQFGRVLFIHYLFKLSKFQKTW